MNEIDLAMLADTAKLSGASALVTGPSANPVVTSGISFTAQTGWSITGYWARRDGLFINGVVLAQRTGTAVAFTATGAGDGTGVISLPTAAPWASTMVNAGPPYGYILAQTTAGAPVWLHMGAPLSIAAGWPNGSIATNDTVAIPLGYIGT